MCRLREARTRSSVTGPWLLYPILFTFNWFKLYRMRTWAAEDKQTTCKSCNHRQTDRQTSLANWSFKHVKVMSSSQRQVHRLLWQTKVLTWNPYWSSFTAPRMTRDVVNWPVLQNVCINSLTTMTATGSRGHNTGAVAGLNGGALNILTSTPCYLEERNTFRNGRAFLWSLECQKERVNCELDLALGCDLSPHF